MDQGWLLTGSDKWSPEGHDLIDTPITSGSESCADAFDKDAIKTGFSSRSRSMVRFMGLDNRGASNGGGVTGSAKSGCNPFMLPLEKRYGWCVEISARFYDFLEVCHRSNS
ncbi:uncharacterized protein PgNI_04842 [Pyricularia grisea]|uniref:Uncharacterized protein n=1 Tax=Pyricularia grisea TaxID=148305 RepID=A0A6P8BEM4_PYRGI|nr:uncharacterized protein PgNI_04842 [Pyricularia grisea]TLD14147.1 hypothetical protein PgNI_04842 [Pyricularia grisea]